MTSIEREEKEKVKKKEKKQEEEETMQQATWVKYTFPVKHQVIFIIILKIALLFLGLLFCKFEYFVFLLTQSFNIVETK